MVRKPLQGETWHFVYLAGIFLLDFVYNIVVSGPMASDLPEILKSDVQEIEISGEVIPLWSNRFGLRDYRDNTSGIDSDPEAGAQSAPAAFTEQAIFLITLCFVQIALWRLNMSDFRQSKSGLKWSKRFVTVAENVFVWLAKKSAPEVWLFVVLGLVVNIFMCDDGRASVIVIGYVALLTLIIMNGSRQSMSDLLLWLLLHGFAELSAVAIMIVFLAGPITVGWISSRVPLPILTARTLCSRLHNRILPHIFIFLVSGLQHSLLMLQDQDLEQVLLRPRSAAVDGSAGAADGAGAGAPRSRAESPGSGMLRWAWSVLGLKRKDVELAKVMFSQLMEEMWLLIVVNLGILSALMPPVDVHSLGLLVLVGPALLSYNFEASPIRCCRAGKSREWHELRAISVLKLLAVICFAARTVVTSPLFPFPESNWTSWFSWRELGFNQQLEDRPWKLTLLAATAIMGCYAGRKVAAKVKQQQADRLASLDACEPSVEVVSLDDPPATSPWPAAAAAPTADGIVGAGVGAATGAGTGAGGGGAGLDLDIDEFSPQAESSPTASPTEMTDLLRPAKPSPCVKEAPSVLQPPRSRIGSMHKDPSSEAKTAAETNPSTSSNTSWSPHWEERFLLKWAPSWLPVQPHCYLSALLLIVSFAVSSEEVHLLNFLMISAVVALCGWSEHWVQAGDLFAITTVLIMIAQYAFRFEIRKELVEEFWVERTGLRWTDQQVVRHYLVLALCLLQKHLYFRGRKSKTRDATCPRWLRRHADVVGMMLILMVAVARRHAWSTTMALCVLPWLLSEELPCLARLVRLQRGNNKGWLRFFRFVLLLMLLTQLMVRLGNALQMEEKFDPLFKVLCEPWEDDDLARCIGEWRLWTDIEDTAKDQLLWEFVALFILGYIQQLLEHVQDDERSLKQTETWKFFSMHWWPCLIWFSTFMLSLEGGTILGISSLLTFLGNIFSVDKPLPVRRRWVWRARFVAWVFLVVGLFAQSPILPCGRASCAGKRHRIYMKHDECIKLQTYDLSIVGNDAQMRECEVSGSALGHDTPATMAWQAMGMKSLRSVGFFEGFSVLFGSPLGWLLVLIFVATVQLRIYDSVYYRIFEESFIREAGPWRRRRARRFVYEFHCRGHLEKSAQQERHRSLRAKLKRIMRTVNKILNPNQRGSQIGSLEHYLMDDFGDAAKQKERRETVVEEVQLGHGVSKVIAQKVAFLLHFDPITSGEYLRLLDEVAVGRIQPDGELLKVLVLEFAESLYARLTKKDAPPTSIPPKKFKRTVALDSVGVGPTLSTNSPEDRTPQPASEGETAKKSRWAKLKEAISRLHRRIVTTWEKVKISPRLASSMWDYAFIGVDEEKFCLRDSSSIATEELHLHRLNNGPVRILWKFLLSNMTGATAVAVVFAFVKTRSILDAARAFGVFFFMLRSYPFPSNSLWTALAAYSSVLLVLRATYDLPIFCDGFSMRLPMTEDTRDEVFDWEPKLIFHWCPTVIQTGWDVTLGFMKISGPSAVSQLEESSWFWAAVADHLCVWVALLHRWMLVRSGVWQYVEVDSKTQWVRLKDFHSEETHASPRARGGATDGATSESSGGASAGVGASSDSEFEATGPGGPLLKSPAKIAQPGGDADDAVSIQSELAPAPPKLSLAPAERVGSAGPIQAHHSSRRFSAKAHDARDWIINKAQVTKINSKLGRHRKGADRLQKKGKRFRVVCQPIADCVCVEPPGCGPRCRFFFDADIHHQLVQAYAKKCQNFIVECNSWMLGIDTSEGKKGRRGESVGDGDMSKSISGNSAPNLLSSGTLDSAGLESEGPSSDGTSATGATTTTSATASGGVAGGVRKRLWGRRSKPSSGAPSQSGSTLNASPSEPSYSVPSEASSALVGRHRRGQQGLGALTSTMRSSPWLPKLWSWKTASSGSAAGSDGEDAGAESSGAEGAGDGAEAGGSDLGGAASPGGPLSGDSSDGGGTGESGDDSPASPSAGSGAIRLVTLIRLQRAVKAWLQRNRMKLKIKKIRCSMGHCLHQRLCEVEISEPPTPPSPVDSKPAPEKQQPARPTAASFAENVFGVLFSGASGGAASGGEAGDEASAQESATLAKKQGLAKKEGVAKVKERSQMSDQLELCERCYKTIRMKKPGEVWWSCETCEYFACNDCVQLVLDQNGSMGQQSVPKTYQKSGTSLYWVKFVLGLILLIYAMVASKEIVREERSFSESFQANSFGIWTLSLLVLHLLLLISDRMWHKLYYRNKDGSRMIDRVNIGIHMVLFLGLHSYIIISMASINRGEEAKVSLFSEGFLCAYYITWMLYLSVCLIQYKHGLPAVDVDLLRPMLSPESQGFYTEKMRLFYFVIHYNLPFVDDLRVIIDWTVVRTSLDLWMYFKVEDAHNWLFRVRHTMFVRRQSFFAEERDLGEKCIFGWLFLVAMLCVILMPIIVFSPITPFPSSVPVDRATSHLSFGVATSCGSSLGAANCTSMSVDLHRSSATRMWAWQNNQSLQDWYFQANPQAAVDIDLQDLEFPGYSESLLQLSPPAGMHIAEILRQAGRPGVAQVMVYVDMKMNFFRQGTSVPLAFKVCACMPNCAAKWPSGVSSCEGSAGTEFFRQIQQWWMNISLGPLDPSASSPALVLPSFWASALHLPVGSKIEIVDRVTRPFLSEGHSPTFDVALTLEQGRNCSSGGGTVQDGVEDGVAAGMWCGEGSRWGRLSIANPSNGTDALRLNTTIELERGARITITSDTSYGSVIGLYIGLVFVVGRYLRAAFSDSSKRTIYEEIPDVSVFLDLVVAVQLAREHADLRTEFQLYYELMKVLRSTDLLLTNGGHEVKDYGVFRTETCPHDCAEPSFERQRGAPGGGRRLRGASPDATVQL